MKLFVSGHSQFISFDEILKFNNKYNVRKKLMQKQKVKIQNLTEKN